MSEAAVQPRVGASFGRRGLALIGAPSGLGAGVRATAEGPAALERWGLARRLAACGLAACWQMLAFDHADDAFAHGEKYFAAVAARAATLADGVAAAIAARGFPVVIGGDHSLAMGTWAGVARGLGRAPLGLVWFDAHLDAHTPATTPSMNAHGMPAAALLGHGHPLFRALAGGTLAPERLCFVGIRSYEPAEMAFLKTLGVRVMLMPEVAERGVAASLGEAFAIASGGGGAWGLSIDLDGFDPADAPGVGLREPGGMRADAVCAALRCGLPRERLAAVEIVEYVPALDADGRTASLVLDLLTALFA
jgi:arginase